jgi:hypothetical protein
MFRETLSPTLHTTRANPQAGTIKEKNFHAITALVGKQIKVATQGVLLQMTGDKAMQSVEPKTHIC